MVTTTPSKKDHVGSGIDVGADPEKIKLDRFHATQEKPNTRFGSPS